jgi:hypothetical protein
MVGTALLEVDVAELAVELDELEAVLEVEDELPHPAITATVSSAVATAPIRLKDISTPFQGGRHRRHPRLSWTVSQCTAQVVPKVTLSHSHGAVHRS